MKEELKKESKFNVYLIVDFELRFVASFRYWEDVYSFISIMHEKYSLKYYVSLNF